MRSSHAILGGTVAAAIAWLGACNEIAGIPEGILATTGSSGGTGGTAATGGSGGTISTASTGTTTSSICEEGQNQPCYTGPPKTQHVGLCKDGVQICASGMWGGCMGDTTPSIEECDGKDNNCDDMIDEGCSCTPGSKQLCYDGPDGTQGVGVCTGGMQTCGAAGVWGPCMGEHKPGAEDCTNPDVDDDCNGAKDDIPGLGNQCDTGSLGPCGPGVSQCVGTSFVCKQVVQPTAEACDGLDNNCNGVVDDVGSQQCTAGSVIQCAGSLACAGMVTTCAPKSYFFDSFGTANSPNNWSLDVEWAIGPTAAGGNPMFGNPDPPLDTSPTADNKVAGVVLGGNGQTAPSAPSYLTMKNPVPLAAVAGPVYLGFWRYLNTTVGYLDTVDIWNGSSWSTVWSSGGANVADSGWTLQKIDVANLKTDSFKVRFGHAVTGGGPTPPTVSSWNIDDVLIAPCIPD